jgi:hypothetical protein
MKPLVISVVAALSIIGLAACSQQPPPPPPQQAAAPPPPQYMPPPPMAPAMEEPPPKYTHHCKAGRHWVPAHYTANHHRVRGHCSWGHGYRPSTVGKRGL